MRPKEFQAMLLSVVFIGAIHSFPWQSISARKAVRNLFWGSTVDESIMIDLELGGAGLDDKKVGGLSDTSVELVESKLARFNLNNTILVKGYFKESLPKYQNRRFSFVHLDCDMYTAYKECLEFFYPRLNLNGILLFDEYNDPAWPGCNLAVDEFLLDKPEKVHPIVRDNFQKFFLVKEFETKKIFTKSAGL